LWKKGMMAPARDAVHNRRSRTRDPIAGQGRRNLATSKPGALGLSPLANFGTTTPSPAFITALTHHHLYTASNANNRYRHRGTHHDFPRASAGSNYRLGAFTGIERKIARSGSTNPACVLRRCILFVDESTASLHSLPQVAVAFEPQQTSLIREEATTSPTQNGGKEVGQGPAEGGRYDKLFACR
jgi:hypothetical protein